MKKVFVYLLFGVFTLTQLATAKISPLCRDCTECDYPVCATNGTHWFLFKNECRLKSENTKREKFGSMTLKKTDIANCFQRCDQVCTDEYAPICTTSGNARRTFQNRCQLDLENCRTNSNWKILHEGECSYAMPFPPATTPPTEPVTMPPPDYDCPTYCNMEYQPICASFDGNDRTFHNLCYLKKHICISGRDWKIKYEGECGNSEEECNEACPRIYSPICATFNGENKTFSNECLLDLEICKTKNKWKTLYNGECKEPEPECQTICPEIYEPVCGSYNGQMKTFPNTCFLKAEACKTRQDWVVEYNGECRPPPVRCPDACPFIYQPICCVLNGVTKTFPNRCVLDVEICKTGNKWEIISTGECQPPSPVPPTFEPAEPSQPYYPPPNPALPALEPYYPPPKPVNPPLPLYPPIAPPHPETPPPPPTQNCPDMCPALYKPVCASFKGSKRTFSNTCELGVTICKTGQDWKVLFDGPCENAIQVNAENSEVLVCPAIYDPICASFNGMTKTFSNKCQLDAEMERTGQAWDILGPGECEVLRPADPTGPCPKCTNLYKPVCGFHNGEQRTFTNECHLLGENCYSEKKWVKLYDGECKMVDKPRNCPNICPLYYDPVCAMYNGVKKTFPNECELNHEAYKTNTDWVFLNRGECDICPVCSDEVDPVCAKFNDQIKTFDNACKMDYENCKTGSEWKIVSKSLCEINNCPQLCPTIYSPVCAVNANNERKTFGNTCEMNREACNTQMKWTLLGEGECPTEEDDCPKSCPAGYSPVCAIHQGVSKTFDNECFLRAEICKTKKNWFFIHQGPCSEPTPPPPPPPSPAPSSIPPTTTPKPAEEEPEPSPITNKKLLAYLIGRIKQYNGEKGNPMAPVRKPCQIVDCLDVYEPVCATFNGENVEFTNMCYMENTKCATGEDWQIINYGPCQRSRRDKYSRPDYGILS